MSTRKFLLSLAALAAIGIAIAGWTSRPAHADIVSVTSSSIAPPVGTPVTITVNLTNMAAGQQVLLYASSGVFTGGSSTAGSFPAGTSSVNPLQFTSTAGGTGFTATYVCTQPSLPVTFTASQAGLPNGQTTITCSGAAATGITVTPSTALLNQQVQVSANCAAGGQTLFASGGGSFGTVPAPQNGQINTPTSVVCTAPGPMIAYFYCNTVQTVTFTLVATQGNLTCSGSQAGGITATPPSVPVGGSATISGNCLGGQIVTASAGGVFISVLSGATYTSQNSLTCAGGPFSATFVCGQQPIQVTFTSGTMTGTLGCGVAASGGLNINPPAGTTTAITAQCTVPGQQLTATGPGTFAGANINGQQIPNVAGTTVATCTSLGTLTAQFNCSANGTASFNLAGITGTFTCTSAGAATCPAPGVLNPLTGQCLGAATGGAPATVTVAANPSSLQCSGSSSVAFVSVTVKDAAGQNVADNTNVTITADSGTFAPSQATTLGGATQFIYSPASTSSGTVNIRANAGSAQGTTAVNVSCSGGSSTTPPPVSAPVISPPPPPTGPVSIMPPNTGDAGLAAAGARDWQRYAAALIIVAVMAGALAIVRSKA